MGDFKETARQHVQSCKTKSDVTGLKYSERNIEAGQRAAGTGKNQKIMQGQGRRQAEVSAQHEDVLLHQNIRKLLKHEIQGRGGLGLPQHKAQG